MGFFDKFKKKKEDELEKQVAELKEKNATMSPDDAANMMKAFTAFVTENAETPLASDAKVSFKADGTYEQKKVVKVSAEANAAYQAATALFDERGEWDDDVFNLYKEAADLGEPYACQALGEYFLDACEDEQAQPYLNKAREFGLKC